MPVADEDVIRVVEAISRDLCATLGWSAEDAAAFVRSRGCVEDYALHAEESLTLAAHVIGNVQEAVQRDEGIDTSWPLCLHHRTHPLTIDRDLVWRCPLEDDEHPDGYMRHIPIGWLDAVWPRT